MCVCVFLVCQSSHCQTVYVCLCVFSLSILTLSNCLMCVCVFLVCQSSHCQTIYVCLCVFSLSILTSSNCLSSMMSSHWRSVLFHC